MHILPYLASGGKLPKLSACFLNSNSATPKPSVPFGVVTCNSGLTFEAARSDLTIRLLDVRDPATKKVEFAVPSTARRSELHHVQTRDRRTPCCVSQLLPQQLQASSHGLLGQSILSCPMRGLLPHSTAQEPAHHYVATGIRATFI